jgi:hypothetical protein
MEVHYVRVFPKQEGRQAGRIHSSYDYLGLVEDNMTLFTRDVELKTDQLGRMKILINRHTDLCSIIDNTIRIHSERLDPRPLSDYTEALAKLATFSRKIEAAADKLQNLVLVAEGQLRSARCLLYNLRDKFNGREAIIKLDATELAPLSGKLHGRVREDPNDVRTVVFRFTPLEDVYGHLQVWLMGENYGQYCDHYWEITKMNPPPDPPWLLSSRSTAPAE